MCSLHPGSWQSHLSVWVNLAGPGKTQSALRIQHMSENIDSTRRRILVGTATGLAGLLSGCSGLNDGPRSNAEPPEVVGGNQDDGTQPNGGDGQNTNEYPRTPSESDYVENGLLKHPPLVTSFRIDELSEQGAAVEMNVMPNPIDDYEISVHLTPLNEVPTAWEYRVPPSEWYGGSPTYDPDLGRWTGRDTTPLLGHRVPQDHGERIGSITVPASAAGTASDAVPSLPDGVSRPQVEQGTVPEDRLDAFREWLGQLGEIGDRYDDLWFDQGGLRRPDEFDPRVGARYFDALPQGLPFLVDVGFPSDIPTYEPFAITFQVHDENSPDAPSVAAFTGQFFRDTDGFDYPSVLREERRTSLKTQDFTGYYGNTTPTFDNVIDEYRGTGRAKGGGAKIVKEFTFFRISSYGLYSQRIRDIVRQARERANGDTGISTDTLTPVLPANYIDSPIQHPWSIELEITNGDAYVAQETAERIKRNADHELFALPRSEEIQQHDIVQELARKLKGVCDGIGATQPTEQLRVVADFVQYMSHITVGVPLDNKTIASTQVPPEYITPGGHHPVWTLYNEVGDCEDYTVLMNTILRTDHFGFDTAAAAFEDVAILASEDVGHVSTAVPMSDVEIDGVEADQNVGSEDGDVVIYQPATFSYRGDEYMYVEGSTISPVGHVIKDVKFDVPPTHAAENDLYR